MLERIIEAFILGFERWLSPYPDLSRLMVRLGHLEVTSDTYYHLVSLKLPPGLPPVVDKDISNYEVRFISNEVMVFGYEHRYSKLPEKKFFVRCI